MKTQFRLLLAGAAACALGVSDVRAEQVWKVTDGTASATLFTSVLRDQGLNVLDLRSTAKGSAMMSDSVGFRIDSTSLRFNVTNSAFSGFAKGEVRASGGFAIAAGKKVFSLQGFAIAPRAVMAEEGLTVSPRSGTTQPLLLTMQNPVVHFNSATGRLLVGMADLHLSPKTALAMGRPELGGLLIGMMHIEADSAFESGDPNDKPMPGGGDLGDEGNTIDVSLSALSSLTSTGRIGVFPTGTSGLSMSTTSCNVGTKEIEWRAPMQVQHPVICMNLYRLNAGKFEQIGMAWLKHGFLSTNSGGCGSCIQPPNGGSQLGLGCSDTYGTGNNSDRRYLGPREEVNPFTGVWNCVGSWFSNFQPDCIRRNDGTGLNAVAHKLEVLDADLNVPSSEFIYEAYYVTPDDVNKYNQIGWRRATASWSGSVWNFSTTTNLSQGTAIQNIGWADVSAIANPRTEGDVIVAVNHTSLGGGVFRYDYAVYVHDMDRQIREFSVPAMPGLTVTNIQFRDVDQDGANQWTGVYANGKVSWATQTFAQNPNANSLKWGRMYNFRFDANSAPVNTCVNLGLFKPGAMFLVSAMVQGPSATTVTAPDSVTVTQGAQSGGNLASLYTSDNNHLSVVSDENTPSSQFEVVGTSPCPMPSILRFNLESRHSRNDSDQIVRLWNYTTIAWEQVDARQAATVDTAIQIVISSNASRFVGPNSQMRAQVTYTPANEVDGFDVWGPFIDVAGWQNSL